MNLTDEQKYKVLAHYGLKPWEGDLVEGPDGLQIVPYEGKVEETGVMGAFGKSALSNVPRIAAGTVAGVGSAALAEPIIAKTSTAAAGLASPLGPAAPFVGGAVHGLGSLAAYGVGNAAGEALYDKVLGGSVDDAVYGDARARLRAQIEHPTASRMGQTAAMAASFQFSNPVKLAKALGQATKLGALSRGETFVTPESAQVLKDVARNVIGNTAGTGILQMVRNGELDPKELLTTAAEGLLYGGVRSVPGALGASIERMRARKMAEAAELAKKAKAGTPPPLLAGAKLPEGARSDEPVNRPFYTTADEPVGLQLAREDGRLAQQMAEAREKGLAARETQGPEAPAPEPKSFEQAQAEQQAIVEKNLRDWQLRRALEPGKFTDHVPTEPGPDAPPMRREPLTDAEWIQRDLEGEHGPNRWQGAPTTAGEPFDINAERGALKRRGFEFTETPERMTTPDGRPVSGSFNRDTRQIQVSQPHMQKDTHVHEGMHAELLDMQNSPNPHVRKAAGEILQAAGQYSDPEEFLVELATARSRGGRDQNPVMKYLSDNWNALRVIMGAKSPDRMARLLAERFDEMPSAPVNEPLKKSDNGMRYQPLHEMFPDKFKQWFGDYETEPHRASQVVDAEGRPMVVTHGTKRSDFNTFDMSRTPEMGMHFGDPAQSNDFVASTPMGMQFFESVNNPKNYLMHDPSRKDGIFPTYLNIRKPLIAPDKFGTDPTDFIRWLKQNSLVDPHFIDAAAAQLKSDNYKHSWDIIKQGLMEKGYDGIKYQNLHEGRPGAESNVAWIAFHPEQIKSAIGNQGTFDKSNHDIRFQELTDKDSLVPSSVLGKAAAEDEAVGRQGAKAYNEIDMMQGKINKYIEALKKYPQEVIDSAIWKRSKAGQMLTQPRFTPEEAAVNDIYQQAMNETAQLATAHGYPIEQKENYVAEMMSGRAARDFQVNEEAFMKEHLPKFLDYNQQIFKGTFDPLDAEVYFRKYMEGVRKSPNSIGSEFGALTKSARKYHLHDDIREQDMLRNFQRYGGRWARGVAIKQHIRNDPYVAGKLGYDRNVIHPSGAEAPATSSQAMQNLRASLEDTLFNEGRGTSGLSQDARDVVLSGQRVVNTMTMQTLSNLKNTIASVPMHLINAQNPESAMALVTGTMRAHVEYETQKAKAIEAGVIKPHTDPANDIDQPLTTKVSNRLQQVGEKLYKWSASELLEHYNRVRDFTIGEDLARVNLELQKKGDPSAQRFLEQFGYGADTNQPLEEQITRIARNYAKGIQGTYSGEGLPALMLKGGPVSMMLRIQRFGVENFNRTRQMVIQPAIKGNYGPLVAYVLGLAVTAPAITAITKILSGRPSGLPTDEEIKAGKKKPLVQKTLNVMEMAQMVGAFGTVGNVAGSLAKNVRGGSQQLVGDPSINFASSVIMNTAAAIDALDKKEPVLGVLQEVLKRTILENMQITRGLSVDRGLAQDQRNKNTFEYQTEQREVPMSQVVANSIKGNLFSERTPIISPTKAKAKEGDAEARAQVPYKERAALDNYKGGYEDPQKEGEYQRYLLKTQGPKALADYQMRRQKVKVTAQGRP